MQNPRILVAPLDWGLGHVTRCIPIVNELISRGCEVWIGAEGQALKLLQEEIPGVRFLPLTGYRIFYHNAKQNFTVTLLKQLPKIWSAIRKEHGWLNQILQQHHFDAVISDNRYGLWSKKTLSVFITHQINIRSGLGSVTDAVLRGLHYRLINKFGECWIPDYEGEYNIAGKLSHGTHISFRTKYIGLLSRMQCLPAIIKYDIAIILSGPEPRRSIWENRLLSMLHSFTGKVLLVRGLPAESEQLPPVKGVTIVDFLPAAALNIAIQSSEWVICRSGYSSVMDLLRLKHKAILVPTPGQTEQEYLATQLHDKGIFYTVKEELLSLEKHLQEAGTFPFDFTGMPENDYILKKQIDDLLHVIKKRAKMMSLS